MQIIRCLPQISSLEKPEMLSFRLLRKEYQVGIKKLSIMYQTDPPRSPKEFLPTMYDLPSEDPEEPGLPDEYHLL